MSINAGNCAQTVSLFLTLAEESNPVSALAACCSLLRETCFNAFEASVKTSSFLCTKTITITTKPTIKCYARVMHIILTVSNP